MMGIDGILNVRGGYYQPAPELKAEKEKTGGAGMQFSNCLNMTERQNRNTKGSGDITRDTYIRADNVIDINKSALPEKGNKAPYSHLADENGVIDYKGAIFQCDNEKRTISLGDMSNKDKVLTIPLSDGGSLKVNLDNIDELAGAIGMFSPEDVNLILRALRMNAKIKELKKELEDIKSGDQKSSKATMEESTEEAKEMLEKAERSEVTKRQRDGKIETSFLTGNSSFTEKQWNGLIGAIDEAVDKIRQGIEEETESVREESAKKTEENGFKR